MRNWKPAFWGLLAALGVVCMVYAVDPGEKRPAEPAKINAEDLCSGTCVIIGRLGKPYGEISAIRGIWDGRSNTKGEYLLFHVTRINGQEVAREHPITFVSPDVRWLKKDRRGGPQQGKAYEGRVYESGGYHKRPAQVETILGELSKQDFGFGFRSFLYLID